MENIPVVEKKKVEKVIFEDEKKLVPASEDTTTALFEEEIILPSKGVFYQSCRFNKKHLPGGKVKIRPIKVLEEKILVSAKNRLLVMDKILKRCLIDCPLEPEDFLMTDKFFILLNLRTLSYGSDFTFKVKCPDCDTEFEHSLVFPEGLSIIEAVDGDIEPFEITLPSCKKKVSLRFLRGYDEIAVREYVKSVSHFEGSAAYSYKMSRHIIEIDGKVLDPVSKLAFCENMIGKDSFALRKEISERETGIDLTVRASCPSCGEIVSSLLPLDEGFFRI